MISQITIPADALPSCRRGEVLRYCAAGSESEFLSPVLDELISEAVSQLSCRICWRELPVVLSRDGVIHIGSSVCRSVSLRENLEGCHSCILFAATLGIRFDRSLARYSQIAPSKALLLQAIGTERIETLCDVFCEKIARQYAPHTVTRRFSPGYADLPLDFQETLFSLLDCPRQIGATLTESLIMSPSKTVSAIVGIGGNGQSCPVNRCSLCKKTDCLYWRPL